jgi:hypothetical protein
MTETEWRHEVTVSLSQTGWILHWCGMTATPPACLADVYHAITKESKQLNLREDLFPAPDARNAEILRQLAHAKKTLVRISERLAAE